MKKFLKSNRNPLVVFAVSLLAIGFFAVPVMAQDTPEQKIVQATQLAAQAAEKLAEAERTGNADLAQEAANLANQASVLASEVAATGAATGNLALVQGSQHCHQYKRYN